MASSRAAAVGVPRYGWHASLGRFSCPPLFVQTFLLVCQCTPRGFHPQEGKPRFFVFATLGKESAVFSVIAICINQTHATKVGCQRPVSTEIFREMFVRSLVETRLKGRLAGLGWDTAKVTMKQRLAGLTWMRALVAAALVTAASAAVADELDDAHRQAVAGRDTYWNCLAQEYSRERNNGMTGPDFTSLIASVCPSERQSFRVALVDYLSMQFPDADAGAHMTTANSAIASAQKDIVTAFVRHKAASK